MASPSFVLSRRAVMGCGAAALAAPMMPGLAAPALARAPLARTQPPAFFRQKFGTAELTVVSDGTLPVGEASKVFIGSEAVGVDDLIRANFLSPENVRLQQNLLVLNTGEKLVLFDSGMGTSKLFGPTTGRLLANLKAAGLDPKDFDAVVCSHAHVDHIGGLVAADGTPVFPNAQIYIDQSDFEFWTDEAKLEGAAKPFVEVSRAQLLPLRDRLVFFKDGQEVLPGVQAMAAPGHTVGHTCFVVTSGDQSICVLADIAHHHIALVEKPRIEFAYDTDAKQAVASRLRVLDMLVTNRMPAIAFHFPWPGIGHFVKAGDGFRYIPAAVEFN